MKHLGLASIVTVAMVMLLFQQSPPVAAGSTTVYTTLYYFVVGAWMSDSNLFTHLQGRTLSCSANNAHGNVVGRGSSSPLVTDTFEIDAMVEVGNNPSTTNSTKIIGYKSNNLVSYGKDVYANTSATYLTNQWVDCDGMASTYDTINPNQAASDTSIQSVYIP